MLNILYDDYNLYDNPIPTLSIRTMRFRDHQCCLQGHSEQNNQDWKGDLSFLALSSALRYGNTESVINSIWMNQEKLYREVGI